MAKQAACPETGNQADDTRLVCLAIVGRFHSVPVGHGQLKHEFAKAREHITPGDIVRAARTLGLKSCEVQSSWERLSQTALPALIQQGDGFFLVAQNIVKDRILLHNTTTNAPVALTRAESSSRRSSCRFSRSSRRRRSGRSFPEMELTAEVISRAYLNLVSP